MAQQAPCRGAPMCAHPPAPILTVELSAWPQVRCQIPATVPLGLAIQALELVLAQLRELYIRAEVERLSTVERRRTVERR